MTHVGWRNSRHKVKFFIHIGLKIKAIQIYLIHLQITRIINDELQQTLMAGHWGKSNAAPCLLDEHLAWFIYEDLVWLQSG